MDGNMLTKPTPGMTISTIFDGIFGTADAFTSAAAALGSPCAIGSYENEVIYRPAIRRRIVCTP